MANNKVYDIFCENCDNILDITRSVIKGDQYNTLDTDTPQNVSNDSDTDQENAPDYETILKKVEDGKKLTNDELGSIDIKEMVKNEYYKKMTKKGEIKKSIIDMIDEMGNADENTKAYMMCKNCGYNKSIEPRFRVLSKNPEGIASTYDYVDEASYRLKVHIRTIPATRNFNCPNKECPVNKNGVTPEAIFFRKNATTHETIYVCKRCLTVKMN
jgi:hypothetical protein